MEGSRAVGHPKEHHEGFKEAAIGAEGHLSFISGLDAHIVEPPLDVKCCEVLGSAELGDEFGDERERIPIFDGHGVMPYKSLGKLSDIPHLNNRNKQLERRARPPQKCSSRRLVVDLSI